MIYKYGDMVRFVRHADDYTMNYNNDHDFIIGEHYKILLLKSVHDKYGRLYDVADLHSENYKGKLYEIEIELAEPKPAVKKTDCL